MITTVAWMGLSERGKPRECTAKDHIGPRLLPRSAFVSKQGRTCRKCKLSARSPVDRVQRGLGPGSAPAVQDFEFLEPDDPSQWDRPRYWRWLMYKRYAEEDRASAGRPHRTEDHRVDEEEMARFANEVLAEFSSLACTRGERIAKHADTVRESNRSLTEAEVRAIAGYRASQEDLDTAIALANRPTDHLGEEDPPAGFGETAKPDLSNVISIRKKTHHGC